MKSTAAELNTLLAAFKAHELGRPFGAKFAGVDAITGTRFTPGTSIRMLCGKALLTRPLLGGSGVDVLSLACECQRRFVDAPEGDGVYYVVNGQGAATRVEIQGERAYVFANYGKEISLAALRSQRLVHMTALVISVEPARARWRTAKSAEVL